MPVRLTRFSRRHVLALVPDRADDDDVAEGDQDGRNDKQAHRDQGHVELPLPGLAEVDPALRPVVLRFVDVVKVEDWRGEDRAQDPCCRH